MNYLNQCRLNIVHNLISIIILNVFLSKFISIKYQIQFVIDILQCAIHFINVFLDHL